MARRSGFIGVVTAIARETARQQRAEEAARRRQLREMEAAQRRADRELREIEAAQRKAAREAVKSERARKQEQARAEKEARQRYLESRAEEAKGLSTDLAERISALGCILEHTLDVDDTLSFEALRITEGFRPFRSPSELHTPLPEPDWHDYVGRVARPRGLRAFFPWARKKYDKERQLAEEAYQAARAHGQTAEADRRAKFQALREAYEQDRAAFERKKEQRNAEVVEFESAYRSGDLDAISAYHTMVLERSVYPDGFPQAFRLAYVPESKQLIIEYELPTVDIVPPVVEYRYVRARNELTERPRKQSEIKDLYRDIVAATALRTIHEVLEADQEKHIEIVCFNGFVHTIDPATGQDIWPYLISVRTTRDRFDVIDLARIDKRVCLRNLGAQVSPRPVEAQPIRPVAEFAMVDPPFVDQSDILVDLESRPNLMDLNPFEFEQLVANLFEQMGLETKLTRSSKDGGVDCIAFDARSVLGGKVGIQAKRYRHTVGVSAVRDLYGTMMNEGANKGILVTTSGYSADAYDFSKDKPIELIEGAGLLYLLQQVGIEARIIFPDE